MKESCFADALKTKGLVKFNYIAKLYGTKCVFSKLYYICFTWTHTTYMYLHSSL